MHTDVAETIAQLSDILANHVGVLRVLVHLFLQLFNVRVVLVQRIANLVLLITGDGTQKEDAKIRMS